MPSGRKHADNYAAGETTSLCLQWCPEFTYRVHTVLLTTAFWIHHALFVAILPSLFAAGNSCGDMKLYQWVKHGLSEPVISMLDISPPIVNTQTDCFNVVNERVQRTASASCRDICVLQSILWHKIFSPLFNFSKESSIERTRCTVINDCSWDLEQMKNIMPIWAF